MKLGLPDGLMLRLPMLALSVLMLFFYVGFPYGSLDADVTTFGIMGEDIVHYGSPTTLTYGQNYLFSTTPYFYAAIRVLFPFLSRAITLALAGTVQTLTGLWCLYEALLLVQRKDKKTLVASAWTFVLLLAASPRYIFALSKNSSMEMSVLFLGMIFMGGALALRKQRTGWFLVGFATAFSLYTRAQIAIFGAVMLPALICTLRRQTRHGMALWCLGFALGSLPGLFHHWFRAHQWPFLHHVAMSVGSGEEIRVSAGHMFTMVLPHLFTLTATPAGAWVSGSILLSGILIFPLWACLRGARMTALDWTGILGSGILIVVMIIYPSLSQNSTSVRYCTHLYTVAAWLFAIFVVDAVRRRWIGPVLGGLVILFSITVWIDDERGYINLDRMYREALTQYIPELESRDRLYLTDYWDAYVLAFLAGDRLHIEAFPWQLVRTYGKYKEADFQSAVWLIREGFGGTTWENLNARLGPDIMKNMHSEGLSKKYLKRSCEVWYFDDPGISARLMHYHHGLYFRTVYPPGSAHRLPRTGASS